MSKLLAIVGVAVFAVAPTFGATKGIDLTRAGFTPNRVTVDYGDTVTWTNRDKANHQVVSDRGEFPASPVLDQNQTYSYTFLKSGSYGFRDAFNTKKRGTVVVRTGVSIAAGPALAAYGSTTTLSGFVSSGSGGEAIVVEGMQCGLTTFARVASVTSAANGAWRSPAKPIVTTVYQATWKNAKSVQLTAKVAPQLSFRRAEVRGHGDCGAGLRREVSRRPALLPGQADLEEVEARQIEQDQAGCGADARQFRELRGLRSAPDAPPRPPHAGSGRHVLRGSAQRRRPGVRPLG